MIQVQIFHTQRYAGRNQDWRRTHDETRYFPTLQEAREALRDFGKTRKPMYRDYKDGSVRQVGYVVHGKNDWSGELVYTQAWCEFFECTPVAFKRIP